MIKQCVCCHEYTTKIAVVPSSIAPYSYLKCDTCRSKKAEAAWVVDLTVEQGILKDYLSQPHTDELTVYHEDNYVILNEYLRKNKL